MNIPKTQRAAALWSTAAAVAALFSCIQELCGQGFYPRCGKAGVYTLLCPRKSKPTPLPQGQGCSGWKCSPPCPLKLFHPIGANYSFPRAVENMSQHEALRGYGPCGRRQRRFRCPFLSLRSFWVLCPRSNWSFWSTYGRGFSSASPWNDEECGSNEFNPVPMSPLLSGHCHWSFWAPLPLLLAGSHKGLMKAEFPQQPLSQEKQKNTTIKQWPAFQCSISSTYDIYHAPHPNYPAVPHTAIAAATPLETTRHLYPHSSMDTACLHFPWPRISAPCSLLKLLSVWQIAWGKS